MADNDKTKTFVGVTVSLAVGAAIGWIICKILSKPTAPTIPPTEQPVPPSYPDISQITSRLDSIRDLLLQSKSELSSTIPVKSNTYNVVDIDLSIQRSSFTEYSVAGSAITVLENTGVFDIIVGDKSSDYITINPLSYPQALVIDRIDFTKFYIRNSPQPGRRAKLIIWRRT